MTYFHNSGSLQVVDHLTTNQVLTADFVEGMPLDKCAEEQQQVRDYIARKLIELCMKEIFIWRFMQVKISNGFIGYS